ncbi:PTS mannitol transporter subunit IICB [Alkalihalobacillus pseudalcaliphilus]|uniref:PTS mannitol transporter subunit IICB n=1 Tax=Alkalihalobacillus pseudalcaliphilus TaxID=79884 RepID=UPI00064DA9E7|nr:PTS mannitol transporter subunit IICB [Alkalihalobacillus pseudalcaliphilus]KMK78041.1 PTS system mannitol-specific transporter subunit IIBC [Alkalihalobacillus pseudalcaliphilus]
MAEKTSIRTKVQRFGSNLSAMIMPNIGAFIAWGLITALFIDTGWLPNENLATLVDPMITYLLPLLIGYTGGKMLYDVRGGVVGATATLGIIVGADIPMFIGAMIMGPLGGYLIKKFDQLVDGKIKSGFEMLVNNFSSGILGALLALFAFVGVGPVVVTISSWLASGVASIINAGLLPLASIFVEPAKVLFLNNAINHGILGPIAMDQANQFGKSILFLVETNPGPGLGILLAFCIFGKGMAKQSAPGAVIIHAVGGIHEIYFPYILMKPALIIAAIAGGMSGILTFSLLNAGLTATPSPGSIIALGIMAPRGELLPVLAGIFIATAVSFLIASFILKTGKQDEEADLSSAGKKMEEMKGKKSSVSSSFEQQELDSTPVQKEDKEINKIVFACDAGMGSSAMGSSLLKNKLKKADIQKDVSNTSISNLPADADLVITHKDLTDRAKQQNPNAEHISVENFLNSPKYDELIERLKK